MNVSNSLNSKIDVHVIKGFQIEEYCLVPKKLLQQVEEARKQIYDILENTNNLQQILIELPYIMSPIYKVANRKWETILQENRDE